MFARAVTSTPPAAARRLPRRRMAPGDQGEREGVDARALPAQRRPAPGSPVGCSTIVFVSPAVLNAMYADLLANGRANWDPWARSKEREGGPHDPAQGPPRCSSLGRIGRNPGDLAKPPTARSPEMKIWSAEQLRTFLTSVADYRLYAMWLLLATTGMRGRAARAALARC